MNASGVSCRPVLLTLLLVFAPMPSQAQPLSFDVLFDLDRSTATGCSADPSGTTTFGGFERRRGPAWTGPP